MTEGLHGCFVVGSSSRLRYGSLFSCWHTASRRHDLDRGYDLVFLAAGMLDPGAFVDSHAYDDMKFLQLRWRLWTIDSMEQDPHYREVSVW